MISASRGDKSKEENAENTSRLKDAIRQHGYGHIITKGVYPEEGTGRTGYEHSYLVIGNKGHEDSEKLKSFLTQQGARFEQDSVLHKPHDTPNASLIGTGKSDWIKKGESKDAGTWHPDRVGEFHSKLHNQKSFAFESFTLEYPQNFFGAWSKHLSNK